MTNSHHTSESDFHKNLCLKTPIAWGNLIDKRWTLLDDKISDNLHVCFTIADTILLLQESNYTEAANILGNLEPKRRNLAGQRQRTKLSIQFIQQKKLLLVLN